MSKRKKLDLRFCHSDQITICYLPVQGINGEYEIFSGSTTCYDCDKEFQSNLVGEHIAFERALIKALKAEKRNYKHRLQAINELYYSMNKSKNFNVKSYEAKMIYRKINQYNNYINELTRVIKSTQDELSEYMQAKTKQHELLKKIRANTQKIDDKDKTD